MTSLPILKADPSFVQWTRSKGLDGFGPFGPVIATGLDPAALVIRAIVDGAERQSYPIADMIFPAAKLVSMISQGMTLEPATSSPAAPRSAPERSSREWWSRSQSTESAC